MFLYFFVLNDQFQILIHLLLKINLEIIPNPNDGVFNVKIEDVTSRDLEIELLDIQGRNLGIWKTQSAVGSVYFPIEKEGLTTGLYFVKIQDGAGVRVLKMIVE